MKCVDFVFVASSSGQKQTGRGERSLGTDALLNCGHDGHFSERKERGQREVVTGAVLLP